MIQPWVSLPWAGPGAYYGADAAEKTHRLEELGVTGVVQGDHPFVPGAPLPFAAMAADCLTVLTTIVAHAERLKIASLVANVGLMHPYLVLRKFSHLAVLHGGERVYAGIGAGWADRDFEALGLAMPPGPSRLDRLEESVQLARELFDNGVATLHGEHVVADDLVLAPRSDTPPVSSSEEERGVFSSSQVGGPTTWISPRHRACRQRTSSSRSSWRPSTTSPSLRTRPGEVLRVVGLSGTL